MKVSSVLPGEMTEEIQADISADTDKRLGGRPPSDTPEQIVRRDEPEEQADRSPDRKRCRTWTPQDVDERPYGILGTNAAADREDDRKKYDAMTDRTPPNIAPHEADRAASGKMSGRIDRH